MRWTVIVESAILHAETGGSESTEGKSGWLVKMNPKKKWQKRWITLDPGHRTLKYAKSSSGKLSGSIDLPGAVLSAGKSADGKFVLAVDTGFRVFNFAASSEDELREWYSAVNPLVKAAAVLSAVAPSSASAK